MNSKLSLGAPLRTLAAGRETGYARRMRPNRRDRERLRAAERKAAAEAREIISKAERASSRKVRRRRALIRDIVLAVVITLILFGLWKLVPVL
jgi:hypothetical protein